MVVCSALQTATMDYVSFASHLQSLPFVRPPCALESSLLRRIPYALCALPSASLVPRQRVMVALVLARTGSVKNVSRIKLCPRPVQIHHVCPLLASTHIWDAMRKLGFCILSPPLFVSIAKNVDAPVHVSTTAIVVFQRQVCLNTALPARNMVPSA